MKISAKFIFIWIWFLPTVIAMGQTSNNTTNNAASASIVPLVNYVLQNGSPINAEAYIVQPLHLSDQDLPVIQKGWKMRENGMNSLVAVSKKNSADILMLYFNNAGAGVCWLTSSSGALRYAVKFDRHTHTAETIPNEKVVEDFESVKIYLLRKITPIQNSGH